MFFTKNGMLRIEAESNDEFCVKLAVGLANGTIAPPWGFKVFNPDRGDYWIISDEEARKYVPAYEMAFTLGELETIMDSTDILKGTVEALKTPFIYQAVTERLGDIKLAEPLTRLDDMEKSHDNHELTLLGRILWFKTKVDKKDREYLLIKITDRLVGDKKGVFVNFYSFQDQIKRFKDKICLFKIMKIGSYNLGVKFKPLEATKSTTAS